MMPNWGWYLIGVIIAVLAWGYLRQRGITVPGTVSSAAGMALSSPTRQQNSAQAGTQMGEPVIATHISLPSDQPIAVNQMGGPV